MVELCCKHWSCCSWQKGTSLDEATLSSEEIKPLAVTIIELCLSEGISKRVDQSISLNKEFFKFCSNFLEWVSNDLKTLLSLAMPNLYTV